MYERQTNVHGEATLTAKLNAHDKASTTNVGSSCMTKPCSRHN